MIFKGLRLRGLSKLLLCRPIFFIAKTYGFGFVTKALASASKLIRVKASASNFVKASAS